MSSSRLVRPVGLAGIAVVLSTAVVSLVLLVAPSSTPRGHVTAATPRFDAPEAAERYFDARRRDPAGRADPAERYATARSRMTALGRFSSRLGRRIDPDATSPRVWAAASRGLLAPSGAGVLGAWTPLGPGNIGGRSRVLLIHPTEPNVLLAGGVSGGLWRSDDAGEQWRPVADSMANLAVNAIAWHPSFPEVIYVGTGEGYFREEVRGTGLPLRGGGIYASRDGGVSWARLQATATPDFHWVNDLVVSSGDRRRLYAATRSGLWRSADSGATWVRLIDPAVRGGCLDLEIRRDRPDDVLYASCGTFDQATVYRIMDAGGAAAADAVLREPGMGRTSLAIAPSRPDVVYALAASNEPGPFATGEQGLHALYRSDGGGAVGTWTTQVSRDDPLKLHRLLLSNPVSAMLVECGLGARDSFSNMGWYANVVAVDPRDPDIVWVGGVDWFRSNDAGKSWGLVSHWWTDPSAPTFAHADQHAIAFHPAYDGSGNQVVYIAGDGGVFRSDNARAGATVGGLGVCTPSGSAVAWRSLNHGYGVTQFYHGMPFPDGRRVIGGTQDNGTIVGDEAAGFDGWTRAFGGDGGYVAIDPGNPNTIYIETQWAAVRKSIDGGATFATATRGLAPVVADGLSADGNYLFITPFVIDPADGRRLWLGGDRMYLTSDGAATWRQASPPFADGGKASAIAVSADDHAHVAVGTHTGWVHHLAEALGASAGSTWPGTRPREGWVTSVTFHPGDVNVLYATYGSFGGPHVYRSADAGQTWRAIDGAGEAALPDIPVHAILVDRDDPQRIYLGTDLGVFVSTTGGERWMVEETGFGAAVTEWLSIAEPAGRRVLFAFTHGRGAWKVELP